MNKNTQNAIIKTVNFAEKMQWPQIAIFKTELGKKEKIRVENLPALISEMEKQIDKGNYFYKFEIISRINPAQYPRYDLLDIALRMWCFDCKKTFLIDGNATFKIYCEHCEGENIDHDTLFNYSKNHKPNGKGNKRV